ncbi:unnamed protein product [Candidula unifasciata]|uniref:Uncharacterized protein n=1 Tax=Candidula unifasciata TaxID=100452 RepID=A0A8S3ZQV6_9EUPU|nr:unnamed protein product [Candidula unifasciata]
MQPTSYAIFMVTFLALIAVCCCRPSSFRAEDSVNYDTLQDSYLPNSMSLGAILEALKEHILLSDYKTMEKRTMINTENLDLSFPNTVEDAQIAGMKRRIFWQPLGYMPAAARAHNGPLDAAGRGNKSVSSNVFRYG